MRNPRVTVFRWSARAKALGSPGVFRSGFGLTAVLVAVAAARTVEPGEAKSGDRVASAEVTWGDNTKPNAGGSRGGKTAVRNDGYPDGKPTAVQNDGYPDGKPTVVRNDGYPDGDATAGKDGSGGDGSDEATVEALLKLMPTGSAMSMVFVDLPQLDKRLAVLGRRVEGAASGGVEGHLVDEIGAKLPPRLAIDFSKPVGLALPDLSSGAEPVYWVHVADFADQIRNYPSSREEDGIWIIGDQEITRWCLKQQGGFVVIASGRTALAAVTEGRAVLANRLVLPECLGGGRDLCLHLNMDGARDLFRTNVDALSELGPNLALLAGQRGMDSAVLKRLYSRAFAAIDSWLDQIVDLEVSVALDEQRLDVTVATRYREGAIRSFLEKRKPAGPFEEFTRLVNQRFALAASVHVTGFEEWVTRVITEAVLEADGPGDEGAEEAQGNGRRAGVVEAVGGDSRETTKPNDSKSSDSATNEVESEGLAANASALRDWTRKVSGVEAVVGARSGEVWSYGAYAGSDPGQMAADLQRLLVRPDSLISRLKGVTFEALEDHRIGSGTFYQFGVRPAVGARAGLLPVGQVLYPDSRFTYGVIDGRVRFASGRAGIIDDLLATEGEMLGLAAGARKALSALPRRRDAVMLVDPVGVLSLLGSVGAISPIMVGVAGEPIALSISISGEPARIDVHVPLSVIDRIHQAVNPPPPT